MIVNPFFLTNRIPAEYFCDREKETDALMKGIVNQEHMVLMSRRRIGKTGLINHCFDTNEIADSYYTVSIDILQTSSFREFVQVLGNATYRSVASRSDRLAKTFASALKSLTASFGYDPVSGIPTFNIKLGEIITPDYTLDEIFAYLESADKPCIIAIDEFQQIIRYPEKNVEEILRSRIQKLTNTHIIFAGSERRIISEMFLSSKRPFYQSATCITLEAIAPEAYCSFSQAKFRENGKTLTKDAFDYIYDLFSGVTLYVHRVLHDCWYYVGEGGTCTVRDAETFANAFIQESGARLKEQLSFISEPQKELLYAICEEGEATGITSGAFIKKHSLRSASAVQSATKALLESELITKRGYNYSISDPMLKIWLSHKGQI